MISEPTTKYHADRDLRRLAAIVQSSSDPILSRTIGGVITSWNPAAERLFGYSAGNVIGQHISIIVPERKRVELAETLAAVAAGTSVEHLETVCVDNNGAELDVVLSVNPLLDDDGRVVGASTVAHDITETKRAQRDLWRLAAIVESSADALVSVTLEGLIASWNPAAERLFGYGALEALGRHISLVVPPDRRRELKEILDKVASGSKVMGLETVRVRQDGSELHVLLNVWPMFAADGEVAGSTIVTHDMTAEALAVQAREIAETRFQATFRRSNIGMVIADLDGTPTAVNPAICKLLGRRPDELVGRPWGFYGHPDDAGLVMAMLGYLRGGADAYSGEQRFLRLDGATVWLQVNVTVVRDGGDKAVYLMTQVQNITERKHLEDKMRHLALHDGLTGLPNRALLNDRLDHALASSVRSASQIGVIFIDLDDFKEVNDALGHSVGDRLLVEVSRRLRKSVRPGDTVARFGGDEFVAVCASVTRESMSALAVRVAQAVSAPFTIKGRRVPLKASLGITISRSGSDAQSLLSEADAAMYRAKDARGGPAFFDDSLRRQAEAMLDGERALRAAIHRGELVAYYQPIVDLRSGAMVGMEALARWHSAKGEVIEPNDFIPLAEATGLIVELGEAVLNTAVSEVAAWNAESPGSAPLWVSVNLSARQVADPHLTDLVIDLLGRHGLPPRLLHLEVTETAVMEDINRSISVLEELRTFGVQLSLDDFGTGYSSLSYLRQLPVDTLKIDRSFIVNLGSDQNASIVNAIVRLAHALDLFCVAEGVETEGQRATLSGLGCDFGQGYLWSRPLPPPAARDWARSHEPSAARATRAELSLS